MTGARTEVLRHLSPRPYALDTVQDNAIFDVHKNEFVINFLYTEHLELYDLVIAPKYQSMFKMLMSSSTPFTIYHGCVIFYSRQYVWLFDYMEFIPGTRDQPSKFVKCAQTLTRRHPIVDQYIDRFDPALWNFALDGLAAHVFQHDRVLMYDNLYYTYAGNGIKDDDWLLYIQIPPNYVICKIERDDEDESLIIRNKSDGQFYHGAITNDEQSLRHQYKVVWHQCSLLHIEKDGALFTGEEMDEGEHYFVNMELTVQIDTIMEGRPYRF